MKLLKNIGLAIFLLGLVIFTALPFLGSFKMSEQIMLEQLSEQELGNLQSDFEEKIIDVEFGTSSAFGNAVIDIYNTKNEELKANEEWDKVMYTQEKEFAFKLAKASTTGFVADNKLLLFFLSFGLGILGALIYVYQDLKLLGPAGIKNDGVYHSAAQNRGWIGIVTFLWLVSFYVLLYFNPHIIVNLTNVVDPVKHLFNPEAGASQWFLYGFLYTVTMIVMGIRMLIKYRHNKYQVVRTITVVLFQLIFAFLMVEILPLFDLPAKDLKNAWPLDHYFLFDWNVQQLLSSGHFGKFLFFWGIILSIIVVPVMVYFFGKRWYCSWVCGCGGLAETLGDPYRQLSNKKLWTWKLERWLINGVLVFAVIMTIYTGYHTYNVYNNPDMDGKDILFGLSAYDVRSWYGFLIGSIFAGVIGTGFYPILGNRSWCRFGCPLAAYMGIVQRFKSRFRITTNGGQCISCGNCSTYCEQGIDVRAYAQKGQNIVRSSCVGCGVCAAVCPRGVLKLENGPEEGRFGNEGPIVLGNDGFKIDV
ncbi:4Fe-4S binding protein [Paracrocinitomix mangrovi]|uniref:4Fe-4S binding protein n=1 Tax=Paracrocinitomix mangrovi TaxID=2862509 RepID=UPI001C8D2D6F|nr:4Fe-4S dicluster domain-containing protein [Paracrocinitomix mangrovi]UKN02605.1 4Fe-4S binding protein [Paracrocinitomix mangrovi]